MRSFYYDVADAVRPGLRVPDAPGLGVGHIHDALHDAAIYVMERIVAVWPVSTGRSLAGWKVHGTVVVNSVDYADAVGDGIALEIALAATDGAIATAQRTLDETARLLTRAPGQRRDADLTVADFLASRGRGANRAR